MNNDICVVFVCNKAYFDKFQTTCGELITNGKYRGNICLVIGDDLLDDELLQCDLIKQNNIIVAHFPNIPASSDFVEIQHGLKRPHHWVQKQFQYHKFHLFDIFFKRWNYIFYLDCGMSIFSDISPMLNERTENTLLAHSDAYPHYTWKLHNQFDNTNTQYFPKLSAMYNLNIDYFQTTVMLYDTRIITDETHVDLLDLLNTFPISITNDQGIIALYFTTIRPLYKQIKTYDENHYFYDYISRDDDYVYIMLKSR